MFLEDGTRNATYWLVLYPTEFQQKGSMKNTKNSCGIYLLLMGSEEHVRCLLAGARVLILVPHRHDPNKALNIIIGEIVRGWVNGFQTVDAYVNNCAVFRDHVAFFGAFVKINAITDTLGHSSVFFCTYSRILKSINVNGPR